MIDYKPTLVSQLETATGLDVYPENFIDASIETPCITYLEISNVSTIEGDTMRFSRIGIRIKLWGSDYEELNPYMLLLDNKMKNLGFTRTSYNELWSGEKQLQMIFKYEATGYEISNGGF